jgi:hypothetical protein
MKKIELLYFESCPLYKQALENLRAVLAENHIDAEIELINVDSPDKTEGLGFYGSPSIRINGVDLEEKDGKYTYACRMYTINGQQVGVPTIDYIQERLHALQIL